jgi:hypothetical protein
LGFGFAGMPVFLSEHQIPAIALPSWIHMPYPPALRGPAHQAVKRRRDKNDLLSERSSIASRQDDPLGPFKSFRDASVAS